MAFLFALKTALFRIALCRYLVAGLVKNNVLVGTGELFPGSPFGFSHGIIQKGFLGRRQRCQSCHKNAPAVKKRQPPLPPRPGAPPSRFSIGSAPLTSISESDTQISGGETRQDLKIPGVSPWSLPLALSCSRHMVCRCLPQLWLRFLIPRGFVE